MPGKKPKKPGSPKKRATKKSIRDLSPTKDPKGGYMKPRLRLRGPISITG